MGLRAMTWNIKTGGLDDGDPARLERVAEVISQARPDLLALQELQGFHHPGRMAWLADRVGMRPHLARSWFGQPVAVLVRPPGRVRDAAPVRLPFHHAAARVVVATDRGPLTVLSVHLHPYSGRRRLVEAGWLARVVRSTAAPAAASTAAGDVLLMGDLNTLDPQTDHDATLARLQPAYRSRHLRRDGSTVDTRAVGKLRAAGLVDLFETVGTGEAATAPTTAGGGGEFSGMRLDYLLASPGCARLARRCRVLRGGAAESASDHYPVLAELDLSLVPVAGTRQEPIST